MPPAPPRPAETRPPVSAAGRLRAALLAGATGALLLAACGTPPPAPNAAQREAATQARSAARALAQGDTAQALARYTAALAAAESVEDVGLSGTLMLNLALVQARRGDLAAAQAQVDRILGAPQRYGPALVAAAAARKALLFMQAADDAAALHWADAAEAACAAPCTLATTLANLRAQVALQRGDAAGAAALATHAAADTAADAAEQANALRLLGRAQTRLGAADAAAAALAQALQIDRRGGWPDRVALDLLYAAENEQGRGRWAAARDFYDRAGTVYRASGRAQEAQAMQQRLDALPPR